ncbi:hypothetical protein GPROT2_02252 [Gammaproteobacteria bacterium]|nr:hypothetical protein GPROT2_02252 [Gammaproteobacteria bacterium]
MDMTTMKFDLASLEAPPAVAVLDRVAGGFKAFQALRAGYGSGLFDWLDRNGPAERAVIATALKLRGAHLAGFLQSLEDLGLVSRQGSVYALVPEMREVLVAGSAWCQAATIERLLAPECGWSDLRGFLSEDWTAASAPVSPSPRQHPFLVEARLLATRLAARERELRGGAKPRRLLCFDGGGGMAAAAICLAQPGLDASVIVAPGAVREAMELLDACGLAERCVVHPGSPLEISVQASYDRVVLFHALYPVRKSMGDALAAVAARLAPGGELCSAHWFCLEACETAPGGLRDLDRAVLTDSHPLCHVETFGERFVAAGLGDEGREDIDSPCGRLKLHFASRALNPVVVSPYLRCSRC